MSWKAIPKFADSWPNLTWTSTHQPNVLKTVPNYICLTLFLEDLPRLEPSPPSNTSDTPPRFGPARLYAYSCARFMKGVHHLPSKRRRGCVERIYRLFHDVVTTSQLAPNSSLAPMRYWHSPGYTPSRLRSQTRRFATVQQRGEARWAKSKAVLLALCAVAQVNAMRPSFFVFLFWTAASLR